SNPLEEVSYDPNTTFVAFVVGDGDNVRFIMATRNVWLGQRLDWCADATNPCPPVTWSISPHLPQLAPDVIEWYYARARETGSDYFLLPPSGHQYAYPTSMNDQAGALFVEATERDARILGLGSVVHWDWSTTWRDAENSFLPQYATADGPIRGIFPVNVPFFLDTFPWWSNDQYYNVLNGRDGGQVVVFRPRQWRGISGNGIGGEEYHLTPEQMAAELGSYPQGTVTWVYMTSDGGLSMENAFLPLIDLLPDHVQLVSADTAARLAIEAEAD
ncbi:MAG: hypothetical protein AAFS10_04780, partial [Myxococcota bacterium]